MTLDQDDGESPPVAGFMGATYHGIAESPQGTCKVMFDRVRWVLGLLLLVAAGLEGYRLVTEPVAEKDVFSYRWVLMCVVEFEILLGIWLLAGAYKRLVWLVTLACFAVFSVVTLTKGLRGEASCGCFGKVEVNPWYFADLLQEFPAFQKDPRCRPYLPQILYIAWVTSRRENRLDKAHELEETFLKDYPKHPLGADIYFASAMTALAAANYEEASRLLETIQDRFPDSRIVPKAKEIQKRLKDMHSSPPK